MAGATVSVVTDFLCRFFLLHLLSLILFLLLFVFFGEKVCWSLAADSPGAVVSTQKVLGSVNVLSPELLLYLIFISKQCRASVRAPFRVL